MYRHILVKFSNTKFNKNSFSDTQVDIHGWTERHDVWTQSPSNSGKYLLYPQAKNAPYHCDKDVILKMEALCLSETLVTTPILLVVSVCFSETTPNLFLTIKAVYSSETLIRNSILNMEELYLSETLTYIILIPWRSSFLRNAGSHFYPEDGGRIFL
jgi:hypothetical protein